MTITGVSSRPTWLQAKQGVFILDEWVRVTTNKLPWQKKAPGVFTKLLAHDVRTNMRVELYKIKPKTTLTPHRHTNFEWIYVLDGELRDEFGRYPKGTFKINPKNSIHTSTSPRGCILLVTRAGDYAPIK